MDMLISTLRCVSVEPQQGMQHDKLIGTSIEVLGIVGRTHRLEPSSRRGMNFGNVWLCQTWLLWCLPHNDTPDQKNMLAELNNRHHSRNIRLDKFGRMSYLFSDNFEDIHYGSFHRGTLKPHHKPLSSYILLLLILCCPDRLAHMPFRMSTSLMGMHLRNCQRKGRR